jgi:outer membrane protein
MKKVILTLAGIVAVISMGFSQKFAYIDSEYILNNIPAYKAAQSQLDKLSADWQKEIETKYGDIDKMYKDFQSEKVLMSDEMKTKRENEIVAKEKEVKELQKKYFGKDGSLFKKREELVKPIQDEIVAKVKELAIEGNYAVIFDSASGDLSMLYKDPKYEKSDVILEKLGYKN